MNEELTIAIEELRSRPSDRAWFIPVLLSDCEVPDRDIGAGESLRDLQWLPVFKDWSNGVEHLSSILQSNAPGIEDRTVEVEMHLDADFDRFGLEERDSLLSRLEAVLGVEVPIRLLGIRRGSTRITIELSMRQAEQLLSLQRHGKLEELGVIYAREIGNKVAGVVDQEITTRTYDVFMCHNSLDKRAVKRVARKLRERGIHPWLDVWELRPGRAWQDALEDQIESINSAAIFVGNGGVGPWQDLEMKAFIRQFVSRDCPVIPVLLHSCKQAPQLPTFLAGMTWVDLKKRKPDPMDLLVWGITGSKPQ